VKEMLICQYWKIYCSCERALYSRNFWLHFKTHTKLQYYVYICKCLLLY